MKHLASFVLLFSVASCAPRKYNNAGTQEFRSIQSKGDRVSETQATLKALKQKVSSLEDQHFVITRTVFASPDRSESNTYALNIDFPNLSKDTCEQIRQAYGNVSKILCANGKYSLQDFLYPVVQATLNKQFANENITTPVSEFQDKIDALQNNCWSTIYDFQRHSSDSFFLFQMNWKEAKRIMTSPEWSATVGGDPDTTPSDQRVRDMLSMAEFGDMIMIYNNIDLSKEGGRAKGELLHAATVVDNGGIAFERTGWAAHHAVRFVTFEDIILQYLPSKRPIAWEIRRLSKPFPDPGVSIKDWSYGGGTLGSFTCAKIPFLFDTSGRATLPADAFSPIRGSKYMNADCR